MTRDTLVLLPGMLCDQELWQGQIAALADLADCQIAEMTGTTIDAMAEDVLSRAPSRFALAGHSMGGYVALAVVRMAPQRVSRLLLANTSARPDTEAQSTRRRDLIGRAGKGGFDAILHGLLPVLVHADSASNAAFQSRVEAMLRRTGVEAFVRHQAATAARIDSRPSLAAIDVPVQVLAGDPDPIVPPQHSAELAAAISHARFDVIEGSGHLTPIEQPERVSALMRSWLGSH